MSPKSADKFRIAIVGSGRIAQSYLAAFKTSNELELVALVDTNAENLKAAIEAFPCHGYSDHRAMLEKEKPDRVVVCTPPSLHPDVAVDCLNAGAHVLCEKPMAIRSEDVHWLARPTMPPPAGSARRPAAFAPSAAPRPAPPTLRSPPPSPGLTQVNGPQ